MYACYTKTAKSSRFVYTTKGCQQSWVHIVEEAHNVITHDLVNLMILCHDSKLCVSTIITFENSYYNKLYTQIVQTGQYTEGTNVFYCWLYVGSNSAPNCVNV